MNSEEIKQRTQDYFEVMEMVEGPEKLIVRNQIIEMNIKLVTHCIKKYGVTEDALQTGCVGLIKAVDTFDRTRGVPFANYACFSIVRELQKEHEIDKNVKALLYLDAPTTMDNGDAVNWHEKIESGEAREEIDKVLDDFDLEQFFKNVVVPAIEQVANKTNSNNTVDLSLWKTTEIHYILSLADIYVTDVEKRLTFKEIAKALKVSSQNVRIRHQRVIAEIKKRYKLEA